MENQNLNILDEINKGATMGMDAISYISLKVSDDTFKKVLNTEYNKYKDISNRVNDLYENYSKLSELLMQGTNMGIIEGRRLLNQNKDAEPDVKNILNDFVVMQEDSVETLKKYL